MNAVAMNAGLFADIAESAFPHIAGPDIDIAQSLADVAMAGADTIAADTRQCASSTSNTSTATRH